MKKIFFVLFSVAVLSCQHSVHAPSDSEIKKAVTAMYEKRNQADGGGGWNIDNVKILDAHSVKDDQHFFAKVQVTGVHTSPALEQRLPDEPIDETRDITLVWQNGAWSVEEN